MKGVDTSPVSTSTTKVKRKLGGTKVECDDLPEHDRVEASGLVNHIEVIHLQLKLDAWLVSVYLMYL